MSALEEDYRSILDESNDAIYITDLDYNLLYINKKARLIGENLFHREFSQGKCYECLLGRDTPCPFCKMEQMPADRYLVRTFKGATGRIFELRGKKLRWAGQPAHIEYIRNITVQENAIRQSESLAAQQRNLYAHIGVGVCLYRYRAGERRALVCNDNYRSLFALPTGFDEGEPLSLELENFCEDGKAQVYADAMECLRSNTPFRRVCRVFDRSTGLPRSILVKAECAVQANDDVLWYLTALDVTEWVEQEQQLNNILSSISGGVAVYQVGRDGAIHTLMYTDGLPAMNGLTRQEYDELCRKNALDFCHPGDVARFAAEIREAVAKRQPLSTNFRVIHKEKGYIWVNLTASPGGTDSNGALRYNAAFTNVSRQFALYQTLLDAAESGLIVTDRETKEIYYSNQRASALIAEAQTLCGHTEECQVGKSPNCSFCNMSSLLPSADFRPVKKKIGSSTYQIYTHPLDWMGRPAAAQYFSDVTEETELQNQLTIEEERYRMVVEESGVALMDYDLLHNKIYMNERFMQYAISDIAEHGNAFDFQRGLAYVFPDDQPALLAFYQSLRENGTATAPKLRLTLKDGSYRWCELHGIEIQDGERRSTRKLCFIRDVDDVTRQNEELQIRYNAEMMRLRSFENGVVERMSLDLTDNRILEAMNPQASRLPELIGKSVEELLAIRAAHVHSPASREKYARFMDRRYLLEAYYKGETPSMEVFEPSGEAGEYVNYLATTQFAKDPASGHIMAFIETRNNDREKMQAVLMRRMLETNYDSALVINAATGKIKMAYRAGEVVFGADAAQSYDELLWEDISQHVLPEEQRQVMQELSLSTLRERLGSAAFCSGRTERLIDGKPVYRLWNAVFFDVDKRYILFTTSNITEVYEKDLEKARLLRKALQAAEQASQAKTTFLSNISHEIRTPMNAIMGMTRLAEDEAPGGSAVAEYLSKIEESSRYLLGVINDILEMSRIDSGKSILECKWYSPEAIVAPVVNMIQPMMTRKNIRFVHPQNYLGGPESELYVDLQKTQQMLMNLLNNACKFTAPGGTVCLRFSCVARDEAHSVATAAITVEDTGCGMSREFMERIFQPFEQERINDAEPVPGTGLGLAISRSIARQMGGDITVESELGKGSVFTITYPYHYRSSRPRAAETQPEPQESGCGLAGKKILLAEDNELNALIAGKLLQKQGMRVTVARNGQEALELFCASPENTYDFILMDIRMPVMDGLEATRRIRALSRPDAGRVPIVAMSANAYEEDRQTSLAAGMNDHLPKPVEPALLYKTIQKYL